MQRVNPRSAFTTFAAATASEGWRLVGRIFTMFSPRTSTGTALNIGCLLFLPFLAILWWSIQLTFIMLLDVIPFFWAVAWSALALIGMSVDAVRRRKPAVEVSI